MEDAAGAFSSINLEIWGTVIAIALLLLLSGFFSGSETALTAASRGKLHSAANNGQANAKRALALTDDSERLIGSILLGNNLVNILATSLATAMFTRVFGETLPTVFLLFELIGLNHRPHRSVEEQNFFL